MNIEHHLIQTVFTFHHALHHINLHYNGFKNKKPTEFEMKTQTGGVSPKTKNNTLKNNA